jgi:hypothetical protein
MNAAVEQAILRIIGVLMGGFRGFGTLIEVYIVGDGF